MIYIACVITLLTAVVLYFRHLYSRLEARGLKHLKPVPLLGNTAPIFFRKKHFVHACDDEYKAFPDERFIGHYQFLNPEVILRDPELLKSITIKEFDLFTDHRSFIDEEMDDLFGCNLLAMKGQKWKDMRATLSPAFTSSKLKHMVPFIKDVGEQLVASIEKRIKESGTSHVDAELRDLMTRHANDVIASVVFGLKIDSHIDTDNEFYQMTDLMSNSSFNQMFKFIGYIVFPKLMKAMKVTLFTETMRRFFRSLVLGTMKDREERNIVRKDMIHLLMEARKGKLFHEPKPSEGSDAGFAAVQESAIGMKAAERVWSDNELVAQALIFLLAGFDSVSTAMTFLLYELAVNPEVQEKLVQEIKDHQAIGGQLDYTAIVQLPYLDMVISELLRKWPPTGVTDRLCLQDYNMGKPNPRSNKDFIVKKVEGIVIPIYSFHRDPKYFPNASKFDPERFSQENRHKIQPFTYMPFGLGPRNCIASRFALFEVKAMVYQLLQRIELVPCEKTSIPAELATDTFNLRIKGDAWVRIKLRNTKFSANALM